MWYDDLLPLLPVTLGVIFLIAFALFGTRDNNSRDKNSNARRMKK